VLNIDIERPSAATETPGSEGRNVLIALPFYKNEELVATVVASLIACAADIAAIGGEVVFFNDSPDYPALDEALNKILPEAMAAFPCRLVRNPVNRGFVKTMNLAVAEAVGRKLDLILLNSDTVVLPGAFSEMVRVSRLDAMIAFVNPRSDNATLATLPVAHRVGGTGAFALEAYTALAGKLPDFSYVPTAVGFCMLIRWHILAEFGGLDEVFGAGYNEENDLVMRAGRCGYRAVLANKALVRHEGEKSFSLADISKEVLEPTNRAILDARYPEYGRFTSAYFSSPEATAEWLLSTLVPDSDGRLDLAFDFSSFAPRHAGTYQAGRELLQAAVASWSGEFNIHVLCSPDVYAFHNYAEFGVPRRDPHGPERFAVIFREGQPYDWRSIEQLVLKGAVIGIEMLDTISIDCTQLTSQALFNIWQFSMTHSDLLVAPSAQSMTQVVNRFQIPERMVRVESPLSLDLGDYRLSKAEATAKSAARQAVLLVIGNHFPHKYLVPTANALARAFADRKVLALGQTKPSMAEPFNPYGLPNLNNDVNLVGIDVGHHTEEEFAAFYTDSDVIVFPSHYEGFGYPLMNALAAKRPVFVRRLPVFEELWESQARNPNVHFYETTADLIERLRVLPGWQEPQANPAPGNGAERSAREIHAGIKAAIARADYRTIVDRLRAVQFMTEMAAIPSWAPLPDALAIRPHVPSTPQDKAARFLAERMELVARKIFRSRLLYGALRLIFRLTLRPLLILRHALRRHAQ